MSYTQLIKDTLDILDLNVTFEENYFTKKKYKGQICAIYRGQLTYEPLECIHCHQTNRSELIRWVLTTVRLLLNEVSEYRTYPNYQSSGFGIRLAKRPSLRKRQS